MRLRSIAIALTVLGLLGAPPARAELIDYGFSVTITASAPGVSNPFVGQTFSGTFTADTETAQIVNFTSDLLGGNFSFSVPTLGPAVSFDGLQNVTSIILFSAVASPFGAQFFGFTAGFTQQEIDALGLDANNYFAYYDTEGNLQGGGTPDFATLGPVAVPEPAGIALFGLALAGFAAARRRRV